MSVLNASAGAKSGNIAAGSIWSIPGHGRRNNGAHGENLRHSKQVHRKFNFFEATKLMFKPTGFFRAFAILAVATAGAAAHADCTPISSVPYTITQSGSYCLTADLSVALSGGAAIAVWASDVDLDFRGFLINNTTPSAFSFGVQVGHGDPINNVTIHDGWLYSFDRGIYGINTGLQTSNVTVDHMTVRISKTAGIMLQGTNLRVTNNTITVVSGTTSATGIWLSGTYLSGGSVSSMSASNRAVVQGNGIGSVKVSGTNPDGSLAQFASATGIYVGGFPDTLIRDNAVNGISAPIRVPVWSSTGYSRAVGIQVSQLIEPYRIGGLIIQDNTVQNGVIWAKNTNPNSAGIQISNPADHAIVSGSNITGMTTGIETGYVWFPGTPPVLMLNNKISLATTPINGGPVNGAVTLPQ